MIGKSSKLVRILQTKSAKILASFLIVVVLISSFTISSFAADDRTVYQTIAPIQFSNYGGDVTCVAFPGYATEEIYYQRSGVVSIEKTFLNNSDYYNELNNRLKTKTVNGNTVTYIELNVICNYASIYINGVVYNGSTATTPARMNLANLYEFISYPVSGSYSAGTDYRYYFDVILSNADALDQARQEGFDQGFAEGYQSGYNSGTSSNAINQARQEGYTEGYADGRESTDSENLGQNLLGDTFNAPMEALNNFTLYESSSGFEVTLGLVVGGVICLSLFIAFLKIFAGG